MHEVSRRMLSVLLQRIEGFQGRSKSLVVCATNRRQDLDSALLSRFSVVIKYTLPDLSTRVEIFKRYAKQFSNHPDQLNRLSVAADQMSCREIKEICEFVERQWAGKLIRKEKVRGDVPSLDEYINAFNNKRKAKLVLRDESDV